MIHFRVETLHVGEEVTIEVEGRTWVAIYVGPHTPAEGRRHRFRVGDPADATFLDLTVQQVHRQVRSPEPLL